LDRSYGTSFIELPVWQVTLSIQAGCAGPEPVCVLYSAFAGLPAERLVDRQPMGTLF
jgi:hypothetical protein